MGSNYICPLCTLDFSSPEQLIAHVYQVRTPPVRGSNRLAEANHLLNPPKAAHLYTCVKQKAEGVILIH